VRRVREGWGQKTETTSSEDRDEIVNYPRSVRSYGMFSAGFLASLVALMSSRLDRIVFYTLSSVTIILAFLMVSVFSEAILKGLASNGGRAQDRTAENSADLDVFPEPRN
jgi:hypothetical protein